MLPAIYWGRVASGNGNYLVVLRILRESDFLFAARRSGPYFAMVVEGEILQKFVTYKAKLAIAGDFSVYTSKSLKDFIYESNNRNHIFFLPTEQQGLRGQTAS
ncbi:DUF4180 domain-containing protein [Brevibacillus gelatini]|uniref:DUF4180 domain-containing protein n=1 Tax=Brevibacillus gelatini TaxID=1655277 RepID=A0A3M8B092_9BACL|nr:DUF4180 domain-containing protein [Brevibacillus gelatini]